MHGKFIWLFSAILSINISISYCSFELQKLLKSKLLGKRLEFRK